MTGFLLSYASSSHGFKFSGRMPPRPLRMTRKHRNNCTFQILPCCILLNNPSSLHRRMRSLEVLDWKQLIEANLTQRRSPVVPSKGKGGPDIENVPVVTKKNPCMITCVRLVCDSRIENYRSFRAPAPVNAARQKQRALFQTQPKSPPQSWTLQAHLSIKTLISRSFRIRTSRSYSSSSSMRARKLGYNNVSPWFPRHPPCSWTRNYL
jgi:hypothetical protein